MADPEPGRGGHLYVVAGDITRLQCDAWLLPTDRRFQVSHWFTDVVERLVPGGLQGRMWSGARAQPLSNHDADVPDVWLGDVGRRDEPPVWYADGGVEFVRLAAEAVRARLDDDRRPVLALPVLGTGSGGMNAAKGAIHEVLLPPLQRAAIDHEADVVLVTSDRRAYSAAQRVRRHVLEREHDGDRRRIWDLGERFDHLVEHAQRIAAEAQAGNLVLFLGAGVSVGAGLPAWQGLIDDLAVMTDDPMLKPPAMHGLDFRDQAAILQKRLAKNSRTIAGEIARVIGSARSGLTHCLLASLPTKEAVTTNYDLLFEQSVRAIGEDISVLPYEPVVPSGRWLLKLHGSIEREDDIVLTRTDYLRTPAAHGALFGLVQAMLVTRHMLFVGYSLSDEDFHQLVHEVRSAQIGGADGGRFGSSITLFDDPLFADLWGDDLEVIPVAADESSETAGDAARRLQIFLDLVGFEAADLTAFVLDPTYDAMLTPAERDIRERLRPLVEGVDPSAPEWAQIRRLLDRFGAAGR